MIMMKKLFLLMAVVAGGFAATSCSSGSDATAETPQSLDSKFDAQGNAYLKIALNLPTSNGMTRANGVYDAGTEEEYAIKDAVLVLFKGNNENDAVFLKAYNLTNTSVGTTGANEQISTRRLYSQKVNKGDANLGSETVYAMVVANTNGLFTVASDNASMTVTTSTGSQTVNNTTTFATYQTYILNKVGDTTNGLLMTNPPLSSAKGGSTSPASGDIRRVAPLTAEHFYTSEAEAYAGTKYVEIYLERAAAKISVTASSSASEALTSAPSVTYNPSTITWGIQNYNTTFYGIRKVEKSYFGYLSDNVDASLATKYRFVDANIIADDAVNKYSRIHWAEDVNYAAAPENTDAPTAWNNRGAAVYVAENTINAQSLKQTMTTRVVVKVQFNAGNFYTTSLAGADDIFTTPASLTEKVVEYLKGQSDFATWFASHPSATITGTYGTSAGLVGVTLSSSEDDDNFQIIPSVSNINANVQFTYFPGGVCYYPVLIKHFGDVETPLPNTTDIAGTGYNDIYGSTADAQNKNFLGRYGVVRNNWYEVVVDGVKHIGSAKIPTPEDIPDDVVESYLKVRINILSWAKRTQNVTL